MSELRDTQPVRRIAPDDEVDNVPADWTRWTKCTGTREELLAGAGVTTHYERRPASQSAEQPRTASVAPLVRATPRLTRGAIAARRRGA